MMLQKENLVLRPVREGDLDKVHELHSLPETDRYNTMGIPADHNVTESVMKTWFEEIAQGIKYVFCLMDNQQEFIGLVGINMGKPNYCKAEIWYKIFPRYWGRGVATNAVRSLLGFCFEHLHLHRIEAGCATENVASAKVLEKNGFSREGLSRKILPIRGEWKDGYSFAILEEDWFKNKKR